MPAIDEPYSNAQEQIDVVVAGNGIVHLEIEHWEAKQ